MWLGTLRSQDGMFALSMNKLEAVQVNELFDKDSMNRNGIMSTKYYVLAMFSGKNMFVGEFKNKEDAVNVMNKILDCCMEAMDYQVPEDLSDKEEK